MGVTRQGALVWAPPERIVTPGAVVPRARLLRRLDEGLRAGAVGVFAPAGYGKTTLLAAWAAELEPALGVAWLSLRPRHNDPVVLAEDLGAELAAVGLDRTTPPSRPVGGEVVAGLRLRAPARRGVVILDDIHVLNGAAASAVIADLLEQVPSGLCLVVSGREGSAMPSGTLRARRALVEIRAADLAFDADETRRLLHAYLDMSPNDPRIARAVESCEGWAAGLVLAALAARALPDDAPVVAGSPLHDQFVTEFVDEAILGACPHDVQAFMESTSILPVLEPELCDQLTGRTDSGAILSELARLNCLTVELSTDPPSFRYHPLLRRALRRRLDKHGPTLRVRLTRDAALQLAQRDRIIEATELLVDAGDVELLESFVRQACPPAMARGYVVTVLRWLAALPPKRIEEEPDLALVLARAHGLQGQPLHAEMAVRQARRSIDRARTPPLPGLEAALRFFEASTRLWRGELASVLPVLRHLASPQALPEASPTLTMLGLSRESVLSQLAWVLLTQGHLDECIDVTNEVIGLAHTGPLTRPTVLGIGVRALALSWAGRDAEAAVSVREARSAIAAWPGSSPDTLPFWCAAAWSGPHAEADDSLQRARARATAVSIPVGKVLPDLVEIRVRMRLGQYDTVEPAVHAASAALAELPEQGYLALVLHGLREQANAIVGTRPHLTRQELRILKAIAAGMTRREAADHLHYSVNTIKTHLRSAYRKLGVTTRDEAVARARKWEMLT